MTITVDPDILRNTHHVKLYDGTNTVGLILCDSSGKANVRGLRAVPYPRASLKIYQSEQKYADLQPPFTPIVQADWSGGFGSDDFDLDATKYFDGYRVYTGAMGQVILGGQETWTKGYRSVVQFFPGSVTWFPLHSYIHATKITADATFDCYRVAFWAKKVGTPGGDLKVSIYTDVTNAPGVLIQTKTVLNADIDAVSEIVSAYWDAHVDIVSGTVYWLTFEFVGTITDEDNCFFVGTINDIACTALKSLDAGAHWISADYGAAYRLLDLDHGFRAIFFEHRGALLAAVNYDDATVSKVFINGDWGLADDNTGQLTKLIDATKSWVTNEFVGCVVKIIYGPGSEDNNNFRTITANDGTSLTVSPAWDRVQTVNTHYVILGNNWREITGHNFSGKVTDVLVCQHVAYFAMGQGEDLKRLRAYDDGSGVWTLEWVTETGNKASFLEAVSRSDGIKIYKGLQGYPSIVAMADAIDGTGYAPISNLVFGSNTVVGFGKGQITGLERYGEPESLYVFKEDSIFYDAGDQVFRELPLRELAGLKSEYNGRISLVHNVYLYFSYGFGWQRYYRSNLDSVGPDEILPDERMGAVSGAVGYPGKYFISIESADYSSVLMQNGYGWHEIYCAPKWAKIRGIYIQSIPGQNMARLWIAVGSSIIWVPVANNMYRDTDVRYTHEGVLVSPRYYLGLHDVEKFFYSLKLVTENLTTGGIEIQADYRVNDEANWYSMTDYLTETFDTSPIQEIKLSPLNSVKGAWFQYRLRIMTNTNLITPRLLASVIEAIARIPTKNAYQMVFRLADGDHDLNGEPDMTSALTKKGYLDSMAQQANPIQMWTNMGFWEHKWVLLENIPVQVLAIIQEENRDVYVCQATVIEIEDYAV